MNVNVNALALSAGALAAVLAIAPAAGAQPSAQHRPSGGTTRTTADYTEHSVGGDQVVTFTGDELPAPTNGAYGGSIRPLPGVTRLGLIRLRVNFVSELLKSVENF